MQCIILSRNKLKEEKKLSPPDSIIRECSQTSIVCSALVILKASDNFLLKSLRPQADIPSY